MKIAVIGAGIFGTNVALSLSELASVQEIIIFEKNKQILQEASVNNQHRYHLGYHYPRSPETVQQILLTNKLYDLKYRDTIFDIKNNIYFISKYNSLINSETFYSVFKEHNIDKVELSKYKDSINVENIDSGFVVREKGIDTELLSNLIKINLENNKKIKVCCDTEFKNIKDINKKFDFVINCSYYNNQITENSDLKYEVCLLPVLKNPFKNKDIAFTVMDGLFPSVYPTQNNNFFTLSHVLKTPLFKTENLFEAIKFKNSLNNSTLLSYSNDIIEESRQFFNFDNIEIVNFYVSNKVKYKNDKNDLRTSNVVYNDNIISVLQGKITTCVYIAKEISEYVQNYDNR